MWIKLWKFLMISCKHQVRLVVGFYHTSKTVRMMMTHQMLITVLKLTMKESEDLARHTGFSQTHKNATVGNIANFVFPYFCSFLHYLRLGVLVNIKLNISGCARITFQGCRLHWSSSFPIAQLKRSWQYWHSYTVESL